MPDSTADVVVAGHICLDIIPQLTGPELPAPGRLTKIGAATISTGGAVANTGLALHRLGAAVKLMGKVGDDTLGRVLLDELRLQGPALASGMIVSKGEATSYSIVISPPSIDRSFMHCSGANDSFTSHDIPYDALGGARIFHFGYPPLMATLYARGGAELLEILARVHERGAVTSLDLSQPDPNSAAGQVDWEDWLKRVLPAVDLFFPSVEELLFMLDRKTFQMWTQGDAKIDAPLVRWLCETLIDMGVAVVAIKLGERGLYVRTSADPLRIGGLCDRLPLNAADWIDREIYAPCFRPRAIVGTTGSGDCTIAGFLTALLRGASPAGAATAATAVGAASVEAGDATSGVPAWSTIAQRIAAGWPRLTTRLDSLPANNADADGTLIIQ